jgi:hypothetical protein
LRLLFAFSSSHSNSEFFIMRFASSNYTLSVQVCINCGKWLYNWWVESQRLKVV